MLRQSRLAAPLSVCLSTLVLLQIGQVGAARDLQILPGKSAHHARLLLETPPSLDITGGSNPLNSNALSGGLNTGSSSTSILGSGGTNTGATTTGSTTFGATTTGLTGIPSPPPVNQQPQLNYNPLSGFNSGSGRHLRTHGA
ncbi:g1662 [Coccomyxa elongata]